MNLIEKLDDTKSYPQASIVYKLNDIIDAVNSLLKVEQNRIIKMVKLYRVNKKERG